MRRKILMPICSFFLAASALNASAAQMDRCEVESDYDLAINERSVILTRASGSPRALVMRQGQLFVDDRWVTLGAADRLRVARFEQGVRDAMPIAGEVGREAAAIAFTALGEVVAGLSNDPAAVLAKLDTARLQLDARMARSVTATHFNSADLGDGIADAIGDVLPGLIGNVVGGAISAAFSGDDSRLKRMENLDQEIEAKVEPRARALEARAGQLCDRLVELDRIDNSLEYRLANGEPLDLIEAQVRADVVKHRR